MFTNKFQIETSAKKSAPSPTYPHSCSPVTPVMEYNTNSNTSDTPIVVYHCIGYQYVSLVHHYIGYNTSDSPIVSADQSSKMLSLGSALLKTWSARVS